jgi:V8-like Glu-specific endopeptidase
MQTPLHYNTGLIIFTITTDENKDKNNIGTGMLISRNLVLTCAHNVFIKDTQESKTDPVKGQYANKLLFYPGQQG